MFCAHYFAPRYFPPRYWAEVGEQAVAFTIFAGRGPGADGNITPIITDYDEWFLTQAEGDDLYLQSIPDEYLTQDEADIRYVQSIPSEYITQTEADAQGMPVIDAGEPSDTTFHVREVDADFTLLEVLSPAQYMQTYFNISASSITVDRPPGYLATLGSTTIQPDTSATFIKRAGVAQFRRWG